MAYHMCIVTSTHFKHQIKFYNHASASAPLISTVPDPIGTEYLLPHLAVPTQGKTDDKLPTSHMCIVTSTHFQHWIKFYNHASASAPLIGTVPDTIGTEYLLPNLEVPTQGKNDNKQPTTCV